MWWFLKLLDLLIMCFGSSSGFSGGEMEPCGSYRGSQESKKSQVFGPESQHLIDDILENVRVVAGSS